MASERQTRTVEVQGDKTTVWLPVTTPWPLNLECSKAIYPEAGSGGGLLAYDPSYGLACHHTEVTAWWRNRDISTSRTWSLGPLECDGAYTTASSSKVNDQDTIIGCCPSNYDYPLDSGGRCSSMLPSGHVLQYTVVNTENGQLLELTTTTMQTSRLVGAPYVYGHIRAIVTTPVTSTILQTATENSQPTYAPTRVATAQSPSSLSKGSLAGIGIAVGLGVLGMISLLIVVIIMYRRRFHRSSPPDTTPTDPANSIPLSPQPQAPWNEALGGAFAPGVNGNPPLRPSQPPPEDPPWVEAIGGAFAPGRNGNPLTRAQELEIEALRRESARIAGGIAVVPNVSGSGSGSANQRGHGGGSMSAQEVVAARMSRGASASGSGNWSRKGKGKGKGKEKARASGSGTEAEVPQTSLKYA